MPGGRGYPSAGRSHRLIKSLHGNLVSSTTQKNKAGRPQDVSKCLKSPRWSQIVFVLLCFRISHFSSCLLGTFFTILIALTVVWRALSNFSLGCNRLTANVSPTTGMLWQRAYATMSICVWPCTLLYRIGKLSARHPNFSPKKTLKFWDFKVSQTRLKVMRWYFVRWRRFFGSSILNSFARTFWKFETQCLAWYFRDDVWGWYGTSFCLVAKKEFWERFASVRRSQVLAKWFWSFKSASSCKSVLGCFEVSDFEAQ